MSLEDLGYKVVEDRPEHRVYLSSRPMCPRCPHQLHWVHGSWQCSTCKYKEGCCEGEPQS